MSFLITRPEHDDTTYYLSSWGKEVIEVAKDRNINVIDLKKDRANRKEVISIIKKKNPSFVVFNGHGNYDSIAGHKNEILIKAGENEKLLKAKIVYAISCKSAKQLGPKSMKAGALDYIGYDEDFIFVYDPKFITHPSKDGTVKLFLEPSNEIIISILKGNSTKIAVKRSQHLFKKNISKLLSSEASPEDITYAKYLWWDRKHQVRSSKEDYISLS